MMMSENTLSAGNKVRIHPSARCDDPRVKALQEARRVGVVASIDAGQPYPIWVEWERVAEVFKADELERVDEAPPVDVSALQVELHARTAEVAALEAQLSAVEAERDAGIAAIQRHIDECNIRIRASEELLTRRYDDGTQEEMFMHIQFRDGLARALRHIGAALGPSKADAP